MKANASATTRFCPPALLCSPVSLWSQQWAGCRRCVSSAPCRTVPKRGRPFAPPKREEPAGDLSASVRSQAAQGITERLRLGKRRAGSAAAPLEASEPRPRCRVALHVMALAAGCAMIAAAATASAHELRALLQAGATTAADGRRRPVTSSGQLLVAAESGHGDPTDWPAKPSRGNGTATDHPRQLRHAPREEVSGFLASEATVRSFPWGEPARSVQQALGRPEEGSSASSTSSETPSVVRCVKGNLEASAMGSNQEPDSYGPSSGLSGLRRGLPGRRARVDARALRGEPRRGVDS